MFERSPMFRDISRSRRRIERGETKKKRRARGEEGGEKRSVQRPGHATLLDVHNPRTMGARARNNAVYKRHHNAGISETTNGLTADYRQMRDLGGSARRSGRAAPLLRPAARS